MQYVLARLTEASTWAGLAAIAGSIGAAYPPLAAYTTAAAIVFGAIAAAIKGGPAASGH
jgi:hypothetical protein